MGCRVKDKPKVRGTVVLCPVLGAAGDGCSDGEMLGMVVAHSRSI